MTKYLLSVVFFTTWYWAGAVAQNSIDFGIFASVTANKMEVKIRPNYTENGTRYFTNAQFSVRWPVSSGITTITSDPGISPFFMSPQGLPQIDNGYYYQVWVNTGQGAISWAPDQQIMIQSFSFTGSSCPVFEIAHDHFVQNVINGDIYIEISGTSLTGNLYSASARQPAPGTPGSITGPAAFTPGTSGIAYTVGTIANASGYIWLYSGTGITIHGTGNSVTLDFALSATAGQLTVKGRNSCGDGEASSLSLNSSGTKTLNIKVFLEGPYLSASGAMNTALNNAPQLIPLEQPYHDAPWNYLGTAPVASIPAGVVDWVLVELRDAATPAAALPATKLAGWPKALFLKPDGTIVDTDGVSLPALGNPEIAGSLFVVIRHRCHIAIMSAIGMTLAGNTYFYNFTDGIEKAFGGALGYKPVGIGAFGMVAGDMDADGSVFGSDFAYWASNAGSTGTYKASDLDFDGNTFGTDFAKWAANSGMTNRITGSTLLGNSTEMQVKLFFSQVPGQ
jgi:hypothetical protein